MTSLTKKWREDKLKYKCPKWVWDWTQTSSNPLDWTFCHHPKELFIHVCTRLECEYCFPDNAYALIAEEQAGDD